MRLLIVTAWYHPFIHPRAHRWTGMAEHWAREGHEVHVVCSRRRDCPNEEIINGVHVHRAGFDSLKEVFYYWFGGKNGRGRVGVAVQKTSRLMRLATWFYTAFWKSIYFPDDACLWYFPAKRKARQILESRRLDAMITVSLPFTGHLIGWSLQARLRKTAETGAVGLVAAPAWLADTGDPFSFQVKPLNNSFLYGKWSRHLEQKILESADAVTVTTSFTVRKYREYFGAAGVAKMHIIPPLLFPATDGTVHENDSQSPESNLRSSIKIGYFGALYSPVRTPDAFLHLLETTLALRPDWEKRLEVHFYGEIFPEFFEKLSSQPAIRLHGLCTREEVRRAISEMDILLNIGNTTDFQLPSKAVDYMATGKPVVNLSYTDEDPFMSFFDEIRPPGDESPKSLILNIKVKNGRVGEEETQRWLAWLEGEKKLPGEAEIRQRIAPYLTDAIAARYRALLGR